MQELLGLSLPGYNNGFQTSIRIKHRLNGKQSRLLYIVGALTAAVFVIVSIVVVCCCCCMRRRNARRRKERNPLEPFDDPDQETGVIPGVDLEAQRRDSVPWGHPPSTLSLADAG